MHKKPSGRYLQALAPPAKGRLPIRDTVASGHLTAGVMTLRAERNKGKREFELPP